VAAHHVPNGPVLAELLDAELDYDATTATRLSNHLPMALVALDRLGASDARLEEFARAYERRLAPIPDAVPIAGFDDWLAARGRPDAYGALRRYFDEAIAQRGAEDVVRTHLARLIDGLAGAAFHGLIRLAYALDVRSDARIAAGLAYLSEVHQPLGARGRTEAWTSDPMAALRRLADVTVLSQLARGANIGQRMRQVASHPSFSGVIDWLAVTPATPAALTDAATALYAATDDFTALHGLTASHAVHVITPYVEDRGALCSYWFQGLAAAYVTIGAPRLVEPARALAPWLEAPPAWEHVAAAATTSDDEHVCKLVYSAHELDVEASNPLLLAVAARQARVAPETP